jgi:hypothetical protein
VVSVRTWLEVVLPAILMLTTVNLVQCRISVRVDGVVGHRIYIAGGDVRWEDVDAEGHTCQ